MGTRSGSSPRGTAVLGPDMQFSLPLCMMPVDSRLHLRLPSPPPPQSSHNFLIGKNTKGSLESQFSSTADHRDFLADWW